MAASAASPSATSRFTGLDWAPDGIRLAGVRWTEMKHPDESRGPLPGVPKPNFKVVRRLRYKQDGIGWVHDRFSQVYVLDTATGDLAQVTHSECDYATPRWSMDGDAAGLRRHGARTEHRGRPGTYLSLWRRRGDAWQRPKAAAARLAGHGRQPGMGR